MKQFIVYTKEVYQQPVHVQAENEQDAIKKVEEGQGETYDNELDYSHRLESTTWHTEEE